MALAAPGQLGDAFGKKPGGGERPIGLLPFLVRLYSRVRRPYTRQWTAAWCAHWDHALAGSSSLRSAALQMLKVELAASSGWSWGLVLYDLTFVYDTVCIPTLIAKAADRQYPAKVLNLLVQGYLAARVIRTGACYSEWAYPVNSILAGCGEANNVARCCVYSVIESSLEASPWQQVSQFVDDLKQYADGPDDASVAEVMCPAIGSLVKGSWLTTWFSQRSLCG